MNAVKRIGIAAATGLVLTSVAMAPANASIWDNCTKFNRQYPHGVGKVHAHDHTSGTPVTNFKHSNRLFKKAMQHNSGLDGDGDKIACEKA